jgi:hypothetical protein
LAPADEDGAILIDGHEERILTLLAVAYGEPVRDGALGRSSGQWTDGFTTEQSAAYQKPPSSPNPAQPQPADQRPAASDGAATPTASSFTTADAHPLGESRDKTVNPSTIEDISDNGLYHDTVVQWLANVLRSHGSIVETNLPVTLIGGRPTAFADLMVLPKGSLLPYLIEVKTGLGPRLSKEQSWVYPAALLGEHLYSYSPRISIFGFAPGAPLPP